VWHHKILFNTRYQVSCDDQDFSEEDMGDTREKVLDKKHRESLALEKDALSFPIEEMYLNR